MVDQLLVALRTALGQIPRVMVVGGPEGQRANQQTAFNLLYMQIIVAVLGTSLQNQKVK
jgi:hypothetical protein